MVDWPRGRWSIGQRVEVHSQQRGRRPMPSGRWSIDRGSRAPGRSDARPIGRRTSGQVARGSRCNSATGPPVKWPRGRWSIGPSWTTRGSTPSARSSPEGSSRPAKVGVHRPRRRRSIGRRVEVHSATGPLVNWPRGRRSIGRPQETEDRAGVSAVSKFVRPGGFVPEGRSGARSGGHLDVSSRSNWHSKGGGGCGRGPSRGGVRTGGDVLREREVVPGEWSLTTSGGPKAPRR